MNTSSGVSLIAIMFTLPVVGLLAASLVVLGPMLAAGAIPIGCTGAVAVTAGAWRPPVVSAYAVTSGFGMRFHPTLHVMKLHTGIDLVPSGDTTIVAAASGTVSTAGFNTAYGNQVVIDHGDGIQTRYAHMAATPNVTVGQAVTAGTALGVEGATGYVTGPHLHFEVIQDGAPIDPKPFMQSHGAPLDGREPVQTASADQLPGGADAAAGVGFALPAPGEPRKASVTNPAQPIPENIKALYEAAAASYGLPWTLLAGVGMEETGHGANKNTSTAGAQGLMQFMPATFAAVGVDGDGDGSVRITDDADSIYSAANYLTSSGALQGPAGVTKALLKYNHADWYVNDVLFYAAQYGGGLVLGGVENCGPVGGVGNPNLTTLTAGRVRDVMTWAQSHVGDAYVFGANGPHAWDCSSFTQAAYSAVGIQMPRTAGAQRDWLAAGNGYQVRPGQEQPGDLVFWDSFLGPNQIGHVAIVADPATKTTVDARNSNKGVGNFTYSPDGHHIFQIWRVGNLNPAT